MTAPAALLAALVGKHQGRAVMTSRMRRIVVRMPAALLARVELLRARFADDGKAPDRAALLRAFVELGCVTAEGSTSITNLKQKDTDR